MKKWANSDSRVIFNIIIALIVGIIFGNFLGGSMLRNESIYVNANNYTDDVYILQSGMFYDEDSATVALNEMKQLGLNGVIVRESSTYFVYHGIAGNEESFSEMTKILRENNYYDYLIKPKKLYFMLSNVDPEAPEYQFYYDSITYFIALVNDSHVVISDEYMESVNVVNLDLYNSIHLLNEELEDNELAPIYKLYVYRNLVDMLL